ncbi:MAG: hypothetical protein A2Z28_02020 [Chloroflexi bacterium RBG_16_51_9]|nr:MAG: hypothetical protein A2Z28_02020 [Chloroflexi bacterium RBG_16_51_9]
MKLRYLFLLVVAGVGLALGMSIQPVLAQSGNETTPIINIRPGGDAPQPIIIQTGGEGGQPVIVPTGNQTVKFKNVELWINPEYDRPSLLVMLEGNLDGAVAPVEVKFMVPAAAEMYSAGSLTARGGQGYTGGPPGRQPSQIPGWDEISYILTTETFRVEYYDPVISSEPDKAISYDFRTVAPISNLNVIVQQPKRSSSFTVTPKGTAGTDYEGFSIYTSYYNNLTADSAPVHFDIAYSKSAANNTGLIVGIVLGAIVVGGTALWMLKPRRNRYVPVRASGNQRKGYARQPKSSRSGSSDKAQPESGRRAGGQSGQGDSGNRFCTKCGEPAGESDKFCPSCGNKLRDAA